MKNFLCLILILFNYKLLYLFPWAHVEGNFNTLDLTIFCIGVWMIYLLIFNIRVFFNKYALFIIALLIMVAFHIPYALLKYDITLRDAVIASRIFLLYLSYFIFLDLFKDEAAIYRILNGLTWIAVVAIIAGLIDYIGLDILHHRWASEEGQRMRGGIVRAFIPAYWLIVFISLHSLSEFIHNDRYSRFTLPFMILSIAVIVFRQTRMVLGCYGLVAGFNLVRRIKSKKSWVLISAGAACFIFILFNLERVEIIDKMIQKTEAELIDSSGSWGGRVDQLKTIWDLVSKNYLIGAATSALRTNMEAYQNFSLDKARLLFSYSMNSDLGYALWVKNFGLLGVVYLLLVARAAYRDYHHIRQRHIAPGLTHFTGNYLLYIFFSFLTLNHLGKSEGILLFTFTLAALQSLSSSVDTQGAKAPPFVSATS